MRTMVATNQRDYATISHMDVSGSHDKSSCRSATINNNIRTAGWRDGWCDSSSLNSVIRSRRARYFARPRSSWMRAVSRDNKSIDTRRTRARIPQGWDVSVVQNLRRTIDFPRARCPLWSIFANFSFSSSLLKNFFSSSCWKIYVILLLLSISIAKWRNKYIFNIIQVACK